MSKRTQSKILVLTGCDRQMDSIGALTAQNHRAYAWRHGYLFQRFTDYPESHHPSWHKLHVIRDRIDHFDAILWLDADTIVTHPLQRVEPIIAGHNGLIVSTDWSCPLPEDEIKHFSLGNFIITRCDQSVELIEKALARSEWASRPLWEQQAIQEEYRANGSIRGTVKILPRRILNAVPASERVPAVEPWRDGDFLCHLTYMPNDERERLFWEYDRAGIAQTIPRLPAWWEPVMSADMRHVAAIQSFLELAGSSLPSAIEIGCWQGSSTSAFMHALANGHIQSYIGVDIGIQNEVRKVTEGAPGVTLRQDHSHNVLREIVQGQASRPDILFIDGCHELDCVREESRMTLQIRPPVVIAHDVCATICGFAKCEGPMRLHAELQSAGYICMLDAQDRPGEATKRGLLFAVDPQLPEIVEAARKALAQTCY